MARSNSHDLNRSMKSAQLFADPFAKWLIATGATTEKLEQENRNTGSK